MNEYLNIKEEFLKILLPLGYLEVKQDTDLGCDSYHSIYALKEQRFMFNWDGEEDFFSIEYWKDESWENLNTGVFPSIEPEHNSQMELLKKELIAHL